MKKRKRVKSWGLRMWRKWKGREKGWKLKAAMEWDELAECAGFDSTDTHFDWTVHIKTPLLPQPFKISSFSPHTPALPLSFSTSNITTHHHLTHSNSFVSSINQIKSISPSSTLPTLRLVLLFSPLFIILFLYSSLDLFLLCRFLFFCHWMWLLCSWVFFFSFFFFFFCFFFFFFGFWDSKCRCRVNIDCHYEVSFLGCSIGLLHCCFGWCVYVDKLKNSCELVFGYSLDDFWTTILEGAFVLFCFLVFFFFVCFFLAL